MRRRLGIWVAALLVAGTLASAAAQSNTQDVEAIQQFWSQYIANVEAGNTDGWMALWTDGGVRMAPGAPPAVGLEAIRAQVAPGFANFDSKLTIDAREITILGDWAYSRGLYTADQTAKDGSMSVHVDGKFMSILRRQDDGSWKLYRDIFNSNVPPAD
ncbi:MAG: SgcJ/EcaC family oxidoreductase [Deinococcales bacterium]|jgi:uncharacterized protein (TIGR02246 family)